MFSERGYGFACSTRQPNERLNNWHRRVKTAGLFVVSWSKPVDFPVWQSIHWSN